MKFGISISESGCKSTNFLNTDQIFFQIFFMVKNILLKYKYLKSIIFCFLFFNYQFIPYTSWYKRSRISQNSSSSSSYFDIIIMGTSLPPSR